jgi:peptide/nickel transport system substrate-binding protein
MQVVDDETKKRIKKELKVRHKDAVTLSHQADDNIDKLLIRRMGRLSAVRRFVLLWTLLFAVLFFATFLQFRNLSKYYQSFKPVPGGLYNEGLIGTFTNANPLYASGTADTAVSRLVFSGLFKYDNHNNLVGDLASDWSTGKTDSQYIVHLKKGILWHDGKPLTADDVVFTYKTIQNIEAQSSLYSSWQGISVSKINDQTVEFDLPNPLSAFPYSLTNGIVPEHLLKSIPAEQLRSAPFNTAPVGTGPFVWKYVQVTGATPEDREQRITMSANKKYYDGRPKLDGFSIITFSDDQHLINAFDAKQLNAMSGLEVEPSDLQKDAGIQTYSTPLTSEAMAFFNNSHPALNDGAVRKALVSGIDRTKIAGISAYPLKLVNEPLIAGQLGYDPAYAQLPYNFDYANQLLDQDGWTKGADGVRVKNGQPLQLSLVSQDTHDYAAAASLLQQQWMKLGVKIDVHYYTSDDLQTQVIANHNYDILLYGISIGVDPDVYAYWDSSQASVTSQGHLNLSEYKSTSSDQALEAGRTRSDPALRAAKYKTFLSNWKNDAPALALYQPNYLYITRGPVFNYERKALNSTADRFYNVNQWMVRQKKQTI